MHNPGNERFDIVVVGQQAWDIELGSNNKNIATEFSKRHRVLYVNPPLDRISKYKERKDIKVQRRIRVISGEENGLVQIADNLWNLYPDCLLESINWINSEKIFDRINRVNNKRFAASVLRAIKKLDFKNFILFNDSDIYRSQYLIELIKPALSIYYSRDNMLAAEYWKKHSKTWEHLIIEKSDLCLANSEYLKNYCQGYNANSFNVGQGCDFELFKQLDSESIPAELKKIKRPLIGYVGALINTRLDIKLIEHIAVSRPDWNIILVGPEDEAFKSSNLHMLNNVLFTGSQNADQLPAFINAFDVCLNPQIVNEMTIGNYPRKIDEYLAMGKPVVATDTETMQTFSEHVLLASTKEGFISSIQKALDGDNQELAEKRKKYALTHSWENSVEEMYQAIDLTQQTKIVLVKRLMD